MENKNLVNGPVNAFRLEGKIGNINKVIYLFGDYHMPIKSETKCDSFISDDFVSYFYKTMEKTDKNIKYDLFTENYADVDMFKDKDLNYSYRQKYILELDKFIESDIDIKKKGKNMENKGSKTFKNLRLHYSDIRSFMGVKESFFIIENIEHINEIFIDKKYDVKLVKLLLVNLCKLYNRIVFISNNLNEFFDIKKEKYEFIITNNKEIEKYLNKIKSEEPRISKYTKKMYKIYKHEDIKKKLLNSDLVREKFLLIDLIIKKIKFCIRKILKIKKLCEISSFELNRHIQNEYNYGPDIIKIKKLFYQFVLKFNYINDYCYEFYSYFMDIYLLRRILDKNYVENAIVYSGMGHTQRYVHTLLKDFGFKITNLDYPKLNTKKINEINEINEIIPKKKLKEISEILNKPKLKQCVDMSKFPDNFL
jgi:hypothetical protein